MENQLNSSWGDNKKVEVTPFIKDTLSETAKWAKFLAIVGFVGIGFLCLAGVLMFVAGTVISSLARMPINPGFLGVIYFIIALIYFFPVKYLYDFSVKMKKSLTLSDNDAFAEGFSALKSHYKFIGIFTMVVLSMYFIIFLLGIFGSILGGAVNDGF